MAAPVRILILGTGGMANNHAEKFAEIEGVSLVAGVDTRPGPLADFCARHNIPNGFASVDEALAWGEFDAVTNVTPDAAHYPTTLPFLKAGKHVLCEKPLATNEADAAAMVAAAEAAGVVNMVNLSYRNVAALQQPIPIDFPDIDHSVRILEGWRVAQSRANRDLSRAEPKDNLHRRPFVIPQDQCEIKQVAAREIILPVALQFSVDQQTLVRLKQHVRMQVGDCDHLRGEDPADDDFFAQRL